MLKKCVQYYFKPFAVHHLYKYFSILLFAFFTIKETDTGIEVMYCTKSDRNGIRLKTHLSILKHVFDSWIFRQNV